MNLESKYIEEAPLAPRIRNGDSVCFIGDSITGGLYISNILLFYATRFPELQFTPHNCGLSGDSAKGAVKRYSWDIAPCKPTLATIMFGMNDVERHLYAKDQTGDDIMKKRQDELDLYAVSMGRLSEDLAKTGYRLIFITPSIYDQTGNQPAENFYGVNGSLVLCSKEDRRLAALHKGGLVDFNGLMGAINTEWQKKDPSFSIVGTDRVHPSDPGHLVMAYAFLKAQDMPSSVAEMSLDTTSGSVSFQKNCEIAVMKSCDGGMSFSCQEKSLPFPVPDDAKKALEMVPFTKDLNREILAVNGLAPGQYDILVDGQLVDTRTAEELKAGVNLSDKKRTPQFKQAVKVHDLIKKWSNTSQRLRLFVGVRHWIIDRAEPRPQGVEAEKIYIEDLLKLERKKIQLIPVGWWNI